MPLQRQAPIKDRGSQFGVTSSMHNMNLLDYIDGLYGYAISLTHSPTEADDLVQKTYDHALGTKRYLGLEQNVRCELFRILRTVWCAQLHQRLSTEANAVPIQTPGSPHSYEVETEEESVRKMILELPLEFREVILLREFEEFSYQEIATILGCPTNTVTSHLARARATLRLALGV